MIMCCVVSLCRAQLVYLDDVVLSAHQWVSLPLYHLFKCATNILFITFVGQVRDSYKSITGSVLNIKNESITAVIVWYSKSNWCKMNKANKQLRWKKEWHYLIRLNPHHGRSLNFELQALRRWLPASNFTLFSGLLWFFLPWNLNLCFAVLAHAVRPVGNNLYH